MEEAKKARQDITIQFKRRPIAFDDDFVEFEDIAGHQVGNIWVAVIHKDNGVTCFKADDIEMVNVTVHEGDE